MRHWPNLTARLDIVIIEHALGTMQAHERRVLLFGKRLIRCLWGKHRVQGSFTPADLPRAASQITLSLCTDGR